MHFNLQSGRGGRDRFRRDYPPRSEERNHHGRSNAPPSRHLWVGNLSHSLAERTLADHFLQFGELESVAFQPGRSYAFINYKHDEEAFAAIRALQGFFVAGNPLKIEFAKAVSFGHLWLFSLQLHVISYVCVFSIIYMKAIAAYINNTPQKKQCATRIKIEYAAEKKYAKEISRKRKTK